MRALVSFAMLIMVTVPVFADQVFLTNGDRITGKVALDLDTVTVASALMGPIKVPRAAVVKISLDKPTALLVTDGKTVEATEVAFVRDKADSIRLSSGALMSAPAGVVRFAPIAPATSPSTLRNVLDRWTAAVDAGFTAARGNTALDNFHLGFKAIESTNRYRVNLEFGSLLAENLAAPVHKTTANSLHGGARYEYNVADRFFGFGLATFDSNELQELDLRSVGGGGLGFRAVASRRATLDLFSGGSFNHESFLVNPVRTSGELLFGHELSYNLSSRTAVTERSVIFPNLSNPGEYRVSFDTSTVLKLTNWLGWQSNVSDTYLTNNLPGTRSNDVLITTGIRFMFGQERTFKPRSKVAPLSN
jgi:putative salt-induced outer membrane protein YdiY